MRPDEYITPMGCRNCGVPRGYHGWRYEPGIGGHRWEMPTQRQIKYRMIRRRKHHGGVRWIR